MTAKTVSPSTYSRNTNHKQALVESIDREGGFAVMRDAVGLRHRCPLNVTRVGTKIEAGQVWLIDRSLGPWTLAVRMGPWDGGSNKARQISTYTTADLAAGAIEQGVIALSTHYVILYIETTVPARVRVYNNAPDQIEDLNRATTIQPRPGLGIVMDFLTASVLLKAPLTPVPHGASFATPASKNAPISVTSVNGGPVMVTLTWVTEE